MSCLNDSERNVQLDLPFVPAPFITAGLTCVFIYSRPLGEALLSMILEPPALHITTASIEQQTMEACAAALSDNTQSLRCQHHKVEDYSTHVMGKHQ